MGRAMTGLSPNANLAAQWGAGYGIGYGDSMKLRRAFADLPEGQVHYWHGGAANTRRPPLLMVHPGPGTARSQVPLLERLAETRAVYAPDIMGMGDSNPLPMAQPEIADFAATVLRFADACDLTMFDLMGSSLGGRIAIEMSLQQPKRIRKLVLNRMVDTAGSALAEMQQHHAPKVEPTASGSHILFVWSRMRDLCQYFPWFKHLADNVRKRDLPSAEALHIMFVEHIKMCTTSYLAFDAAWRYPLEEKMREVSVPTLARKDAATSIAGATLWEPALAEEPLTAKAEHLDALVADMLRFLDQN